MGLVRRLVTSPLSPIAGRARFCFCLMETINGCMTQLVIFRTCTYTSNRPCTLDSVRRLVLHRVPSDCTEHLGAHMSSRVSGHVYGPEESHVAVPFIHGSLCHPWELDLA